MTLTLTLPDIDIDTAIDIDIDSDIDIDIDKDNNIDIDTEFVQRGLPRSSPKNAAVPLYEVVGALAHDVVEMPPFCIRKATYYREWYNRYEELHEVGERDWSKSECDEHDILFQQWEMSVAVLHDYQVLGSSLGLGRDHECPGCGRLTAKDCECFRECDCDDGHHDRYPWYRDYVCEAGRPHTAIYSLFRDGDVVWL